MLRCWALCGTYRVSLQGVMAEGLCRLVAVDAMVDMASLVVRARGLVWGVGDGRRLLQLPARLQGW